MPEMLYRIGIAGSGDLRTVKAHGVKEAKRFFAQYHRIPLTKEIIAEKWSAEQLNKSTSDPRLPLDWYRAEKGFPHAETRIVHHEPEGILNA
jgi:hypothetical protein